MIRFRNPGTQYTTQIQIIKDLYSSLHEQACFSLQDMAVVIAQSGMMTAYGYSGNEALRLSNTDSFADNSSYNNAKMYAEVFRMLGWVAPYEEKKSYPLVFTYLGEQVANTPGDCLSLYEQCVLGINEPTQLSGKKRFDEQVRFFKCALRTLIDLDGVMYKHEMCLGPMSVNDKNEEEYQAMIGYIQSLRGEYSRLKNAFTNLASSLDMKPDSVDNMTRLPIALMKTCGWIETVHNRTLYGKTLDCLSITEHGIETYNHIKEMYDLRLDGFLKLDEDTQNAMIRLGTFSMLSRAGKDISVFEEILAADKVKCKPIIGDKELLFSPSQTIRRSKVEAALGNKMGIGTGSHYNLADYGSAVNEREALYSSKEWKLNVPSTAAMELLVLPEDLEYLKRVNSLVEQGLDKSSIVNRLFDDYLNATQANFYPLIATLFKIMGFNCLISRAGDNGARWDAIIVDSQRSIPIEIKSPTEQQHISIKAIRQALENKIVLLSRRTHITTPNVTTLAVGYYMPNNRSEVTRLITDIKKAYGYNVGVIDLKTLLSISVSILLDGAGFETEELFELEGLANAKI